MYITSKLAGIAVSLALALGGFAALGLSETAPAFAAPAVASPAQPTVVAAVAEKPAADCARQAWPYVARECLSAAQGTPVRNVTRTITAAQAR